MANKRNKKRQQRSRRPDVALQPTSRAPQTAADPTAQATGATAAAVATPPASTPPGRSSSTSRYAGTVSGPRRGAATTAATGTIDIDERVPYFAGDLRRIVITAGAMLLVIIGASFLLH
ncbi:MAG: hypothetical protein ABR598_06755 [Candidatus Dormibacteria bacterium]